MILYLIHFRLRIMCCFGGIKGWPPFQLFNEIERLSLLSFIHSASKLFPCQRHTPETRSLFQLHNFRVYIFKTVSLLTTTKKEK